MRLKCNHDISWYDFENKICRICERLACTTEDATQTDPDGEQVDGSGSGQQMNDDVIRYTCDCCNEKRTATKENKVSIDCLTDICLRAEDCFGCEHSFLWCDETESRL